MKFEELLSEAWCNLLFAHRNKEYGAYALRRSTGKRYLRALSVVFFFIFFCLATPFITRGLILLNLIDAAQKLETENTLEKLKPLEGHRLIEVATGRRPRKASTHKAPTTHTEITTTTTPPIPDLPKGEEVAEEAGGQEIETPPPPPLQKDTLAPIQKDPIIPVKSVEEMPQFPGGPARLMQWLDEHIVYPPHLLEKKIKGKAEVVFIVSKEGQVNGVRLTKKIHPELDAAILAAVNNMPPWKAGKRGGRATDVQISIPIEFHPR